jgi:exosortase E/protease (VPEID-CTERM system)
MRNAAAVGGDRSNRARLLAFCLLASVEMFLVSYAFNFPTGIPEWMNPVTYAKVAAQVVLVSLVVLLLAGWPMRERIAQAWEAEMRGYNWRASVLVNLALFSVLFSAALAFSNLAAHAAAPPWHWFAAFCLLLLLNGLSLGTVLAPLGFWRWVAREMRYEVATAALSGTLLVISGRMALESWSSFSGWTLHASHWVLSLFEADVVLDTERKILGAGGFEVRVLKECSGYEGIGLVTAFLAFYCWLMRRQLRFPHALLLVPIGIALSWTLNAIRIALLISIGAHVSPEIALNGFHSQAGWIAFLGIAIGLMVLSARSPIFRADARRPAASARTQDRVLLALLVPFIVLMATSIIATLFTPYDHWFYVLKVAAVGGALWAFRRVYAAIPISTSPLALAVGAGVGLAWVLTDPGHAHADTLGVWIVTLPAWLMVLWLACRGIGSVVLVPITEELAFRGYLQRVLISREFAKVTPDHFTWLSFVVTSLLFGLMHERWLAAAAAGAIYALLVYRSNRLSEAIAAHMASNLVIFAWAVLAGQWTLL